jgi:5-formyltetrahydrofolate cyclo-ligase
MTKQQIRNTYREKRKALTQQEMIRLDDLMLIQFQRADLPFVHALFSYWPIEENNEPNTHLMTEFLKFRNPEMKVAYPVSDFASMTMSAILTDVDTPFSKTALNLLEPDHGEVCAPDELDIVFVPLLAFDREGYRVGYGKGFYDRYLANCREDCLKIGFSYFEALESPVAADEFDVPLDLCITPQNLYVF